MVRLALLLLALLLGLLLLGGALNVPDFPALAMSKLAEGGLWTGLALFVALACLMALRPNKDRPPRRE